MIFPRVASMVVMRLISASSMVESLDWSSVLSLTMSSCMIGCGSDLLMMMMRLLIALSARCLCYLSCFMSANEIYLSRAIRMS